MKNLLTVPLPALALLALGGCATSGALTTSTENDGVYYSSSDRTTAVATPSRVYSGSGNIPARSLDDTVPAATTDDANPDYQGGTTRGYSSGTDYYSNSYNDGLSYYNPSGFNQPYTGPGVSSYNYNPTWSVAPSFYGSPWGYGAGLAVGYGYSPYAMGGYGYPYGGLGYGYPYGAGFYDPFFSPYYSPWGYGSGLSIGFGYGFGGFGYPYGGFGGYPYGYGYGRGYGYYDAYGPRYARPIVYTHGGGVSTPGEGAVIYGGRSNRGGAVMNARNVNGNPNMVNLGGGRPSGGSYTGNAVAIPGGNAPAGSAAPVPVAPTGRGGRAVSFGEATGQPTYSAPASQSTNTTQPMSQPAGGTPGRRGFFSGFFGNGATPAGQPTNNQPMNNPGYGGRQRSVNFGDAQAGQPQMQQRSYNQPSYQPQRTYSPPQPQMQPSRSFGGGNFGGGGGGGSFGGGGGGGGRGRR